LDTSSERRGRRLAGLTVALVCLLGWGWVDVRRRALPETGQQGQMTDIIVYMEAGRALRMGEDLYQVHNVRNWPYLYPPLPAVIFVPLSHLTRGQASYAWFVISLGCVAGSVLLTRATLRQIDAGRARRASWLGLLPVALPLFHTLQRGQINALPLLCVCLAIYALARRRDFLAGLALAGAAAIKITPGFAVVYFVYRWLEEQVAALRSGTWQLTCLMRGAGPLAGFGLGLVLGLWLIPALYMGPRQATTTLAIWRNTAGTGYFRPDAAGNLFGDIPGIRESSSKNQSWYRAAFSTICLLEPGAQAGQDLLQPRWQQRTKWILTGIGIALTAGLLWLSRGNGSLRDTPGPYATLAALAWLGITLGKIAWGHFYAMAYPLMAVAWLMVRKQDGRDSRALRWMLILATISCVAHYGLAPRTPLSDIGGVLLPMTALALATAALANRRGQRSTG
jgi:hypothetical protein